MNKIDMFDNSPLHIACKQGHLKTVKSLMKHGANSKKKNEDEKTPLHLASTSGHSSLIKFIIGEDSSLIDDKDEDDNTSLHLAAQNNHNIAVKALLELGAKVTLRNDKEQTPLHLAATVGGCKSIELLLAFGSLIDSQDRQKRTAIHLTTNNGHPKATKILLEAGANITINNDKGRNALESAIESKSRCALEYILESVHWIDAFRKARKIEDVHGNTVPETPMRMLIRAFPDLAQKVFDKCIQKCNENEEREYLRMDYELIDDTFGISREKSSDGKVQYTFQKNAASAISYFGNARLVRENHPLMIMVLQKQKGLLTHPLCTSLVRHKWKIFGRYVFYFQLVLYCLYLLSITGYTLTRLNIDTFPNETQTNLESLSSNKNHDIVSAFLVAAVIFVTLGIIMEVLQIFQVIHNEISHQP